MPSSFSLAAYFRRLRQQDDVPARDRAKHIGQILETHKLDRLTDEERREAACTARYLCRHSDMPRFEEWDCSLSEFIGWVQEDDIPLGNQLKMLEAIADNLASTHKLDPIKLSWEYQPARSYDDAVAEQEIRNHHQNHAAKSCAHLCVVGPDMSLATPAPRLRESCEIKPCMPTYTSVDKAITNLQSVLTADMPEASYTPEYVADETLASRAQRPLTHALPNRRKDDPDLR